MSKPSAIKPRRPVHVRRVDECETLDELFRHCLPAFAGAFLTAVLARPEFQRKMTGTELRYLLGEVYAEQERHNRVAPGLLATCHRLAIPIFVGAPGDGSVFLNSMKLWAMREAGLIPEYGFDLDLHAEVFESCAYHRWGLFDHPVHALATVILGGGVP